MRPIVVFNLYPFQENLYLPSANIVQTDQDNLPTHLLQRATLATLPPYGIAVTPTLERLLGLIDLLTPKNIEAKHKPPKAKTPTPLAQLLADLATKIAVEAYIFRHLDTFLGEIARLGLPITLDAEKKTLAKDVLLTLGKEPLLPYLSFKKTTEGIEYRLRLGNEDTAWNIREHDVLPLTNTDPAWVAVGHVLFRVPGINGKMVNPFLKKDSVQIPLSQERTYFRKFIAKSVSRGRVEAEGFQVSQTSTLRQTRLEAVEHLLEKRWQLKPMFEYDGAEFYVGEKRDRVTTLDIPPDDSNAEISVHLVCRDKPSEQARVQTLLDLQLEAQGNTFDLPAAPATPHEALQMVTEWLARYKKALENKGFRIIAPTWEGKTLALCLGALEVRSDATGDWFDVGGHLEIGHYRFPFRALVPYLRRGDRLFPLPDGTWFPIPEVWFTRYADLAQALQDGVGEAMRLPKALYTVLQTEDSDKVDFPIIDPDQIEFEPSSDLRATLRPYQLRGVKWLVGHYREGLGACLADDMGLGKTLQTIALLLHAKAEGTGAAPDSGLQLDLFAPYRDTLQPLGALIILPASLVFNWEKEIKKFAPVLYTYAHLGPRRLKDARAMAAHDVVLTTYHTARQDLALLEKNEWRFIILDESQQIKNRESEVSKVVRSLRGRHKISLSGTPIENSLADLWTQMEFINPNILGTFPAFKTQFLDPIQKQNDEKAKSRLFARVRPFFLRRTKEEVAPDLPALTEQVFFTEMAPEQHKRYDQLKSAVRNEILSLFDDPKTRLQALQALTRLRQLANHPRLTDRDYEGDSGKFDDVMAQWETVRRAGHKALFFSSFEQHLQLFKGIFDREGIPYAWLTGDTPTAERAKAVERFQQDSSIQAFFMTVKAGGVGLNLTAADYVFLLDPWWNPAVEDQAIARAHRIGRERPVTALRFISRDSIEEKILELQARKRALGKELFASNQEMPVLDREDLEALLG